MVFLLMWPLEISINNITNICEKSHSLNQQIWQDHLGPSGGRFSVVTSVNIIQCCTMTTVISCTATVFGVWATSHWPCCLWYSSKSVRDYLIHFLVFFVKCISAVLHSQLKVCGSLETLWCLHGSFRAEDRSTLSNLSVHAGIELVLNLILSVLCLGRFLLFIPKFTSGSANASPPRAEWQPYVPLVHLRVFRVSRH